MNSETVSFYLKLTMCYGSKCKEVEAPWIPDFDSVANFTDICVLKNLLGKSFPGLQVLQSAVWKRVLPYDITCNAATEGSSVKVIVNPIKAETFPEGSLLYKNSVKYEGLTIKAGISNWAIVIPGKPGIGFTADKNFEQIVNKITALTVVHNLDKVPSVSAIDEFGSECVVGVDVIDKNSVTVKANKPFSGKIIFN
jgi:hypothetical protein